MDLHRLVLDGFGLGVLDWFVIPKFSCVRTAGL